MDTSLKFLAVYLFKHSVCKLIFQGMSEESCIDINMPGAVPDSTHSNNNRTKNILFSPRLPREYWIKERKRKGNVKEYV